MWFGDSVTLGRVARHLAARGLRHVVRVDLERAHGQQDRGAVLQAAVLDAGAGHRRSGTRRPATPASPALLFDGTIYYRGGMTLEALREKIGDDATFFRIMRDEAQENRFGTVTTPRLHRHRRTRLGLDLDAFFQAWLFTPGKPTSW